MACSRAQEHIHVPNTDRFLQTSTTLDHQLSTSAQARDAAHHGDHVLPDGEEDHLMELFCQYMTKQDKEADNVLCNEAVTAAPHVIVNHNREQTTAAGMQCRMTDLCGGTDHHTYDVGGVADVGGVSAGTGDDDDDDMAVWELTPGCCHLALVDEHVPTSSHTWQQAKYAHYSPVDDLDVDDDILITRSGSGGSMQAETLTWVLPSTVLVPPDEVERKDSVMEQVSSRQDTQCILQEQPSVCMDVPGTKYSFDRDQHMDCCDASGGTAGTEDSTAVMPAVLGSSGSHSPGSMHHTRLNKPKGRRMHGTSLAVKGRSKRGPKLTSKVKSNRCTKPPAPLTAAESASGALQALLPALKPTVSCVGLRQTGPRRSSRPKKIKMNTGSGVLGASDDDYDEVDDGDVGNDDDGGNDNNDDCTGRSSRYRGVTKHRRSGRWEAHIWVKDIGR